MSFHESDAHGSFIIFLYIQPEDRFKLLSEKQVQMVGLFWLHFLYSLGCFEVDMDHENPVLKY